MAFRKFSQSIYDTLIRLMPDLKGIPTSKDHVDPEIASSLFNIWRTSANRVNENLYIRPSTVSLDDVQSMQKAGLVKSIGNKLEITDKGSKVIKVMILGDETSSFDGDDVVVDYEQALAQSGHVKISKKGNTKVASWWDRFKD